MKETIIILMICVVCAAIIMTGCIGENSTRTYAGHQLDVGYEVPEFIKEDTLSQQAGGFVRDGIIEAVKLSVIGTGGGLDFLGAIVDIDMKNEEVARAGVKNWFEPKGEESTSFFGGGKSGGAGFGGSW